MICAGGVHEWERAEDAEHCCGGFVRALVTPLDEEWDSPEAAILPNDPPTEPKLHKTVWMALDTIPAPAPEEKSA